MGTVEIDDGISTKNTANGSPRTSCEEEFSTQEFIAKLDGKVAGWMRGWTGKIEAAQAMIQHHAELTGTLSANLKRLKFLRR